MSRIGLTGSFDIHGEAFGLAAGGSLGGKVTLHIDLSATQIPSSP